MSFKKKISLALLFVFSLLSSSLYINYNNITSNSDVIKYLEKDQIKLNYFANKLNYDIKKNQTNLLQLALLEKDVSNTSNSNSFEDLEKSIANLELFVTNKSVKLSGFTLTLDTIKKRLISYKSVQDSLIEAIISRDKIDIEDALVGFNAITVNFSQDTQKLIDISNAAMYDKILKLKSNNDHSALAVFISFFIAIIVITLTSYQFFHLHNKMKQQLLRAEYAEQEQKSLQSQLLRYNEDLEQEVAKKAKEIRQKIYTNFLTGLPNRNRLLEDTSLYSFSMIAILNIDKFQSFNDVYGEELGNVAIKLTATFLKDELNNEDIPLYHVGGDEFALVIHDDFYMDKDEFKNLVINILHNYQRTEFQHDNKSFSFIMSAGLAYSGKSKMLAYADMALKDAKKRNIQLSEFNDDKNLEKIHQNDIDCHKKLLSAFQNNRVVSYFQPIMPIQDKSQTLKYESLVRLIDEDNNSIPPFNFIRVAKINRVYYKITKAVLHNTLATVTKYKIPCSINISLTDIENIRTMKYFFETLNNFQYNELLTIELLETEDFDNYQIVYDFCIKVRSYGLKIALDDFGSGYSNFSHILNLPIDYIKIDATLISNIDRDQNSKIMVETIVELAKKLHIATIAEFVSSKEILEVIKALGVDYAQGFYIGKPEPIETHLKGGGKEKVIIT